MHILCFIYTFEEIIPQMGAYHPSPPPIPFSNYCIYASLVNRNQLLWDAVLVIFLEFQYIS